MSRAALVSVLVVFGTAAAFGQDADPVKAALFKAQGAYSKEMDAVRAKADDYFEKREAAARKAGNKKAVDQVHEEYRVFRTVGDLPAIAPRDLAKAQADAKAKLLRAYAIAVRDWTKAGKDKEATDAQKESDQVKNGLDLSVPRRKWEHEKGVFTLVGKGTWEERTPEGRKMRWTEIDRTKEYVELAGKDGGVKSVVRLSSQKAEHVVGSQTEFTTTYEGKWAD